MPIKLLGKNFFFLLLGQGFSRLGNNFFTLALLWYVLQETGSSRYVGLTAILLTIPNILSMFTGVFVDRVNRWNLMISIELIQIVLSVGVAVIGWTNGVSVLWLAVITFFIQTAGAFFHPAENAVIPILVSKKENLTMANSINQLVTMVTKIIGLALGGILLTIVSPFTLMFINGLTFIISALSLIAIKPWRLSDESKEEYVENNEGIKSILNSWKEGFQTVINNKPLRKIIPIAIIVNFSLAPLVSLNPAWVKEVLHLGASEYGFVEASIFIGIIIGSIGINFIKNLIPYHRILPIALMVMACSVIILSQLPYYYVTICCMVLFGISAGVINTGLFTIVQWITPNYLLGRVSGILIGFTNISLPLGMALGSFMVSYVSIATIFFSGGIVAALGALIGIGIPKLEDDTEINKQKGAEVNSVS